MANEGLKPIKTRIQHKHDTEYNWRLAKNFVPLPGELIVYDKDGSHNTQRFKIGDGTTKINNLPFIIQPVNELAKGSNQFNIFNDGARHLEKNVTPIYNADEDYYTVVGTIVTAGGLGGSAGDTVTENIIEVDGIHATSLIVDICLLSTGPYKYTDNPTNDTITEYTYTPYLVPTDCINPQWHLDDSVVGSDYMDSQQAFDASVFHGMHYRYGWPCLRYRVYQPTGGFTPLGEYFDTEGSQLKLRIKIEVNGSDLYIKNEVYYAPVYRT